MKIRHHCPTCAGAPDTAVITVGDFRVLPDHAGHASRVNASERSARLVASTSTGKHPAPSAPVAGQPEVFRDGDTFTLVLTRPTGEMSWVRQEGRWWPAGASPDATDVLPVDDAAIRGLWAASAIPPQAPPRS